MTALLAATLALMVCDHGDCPAGALVRIEIADSEILLCGHHFNEVEGTILAAGYPVGAVTS